MSRVYVCGLGAVSPAGWNVAALRQTLEKGEPLPIQPLERPGWTNPLRARLVPNPASRLAFLAHPRLRRSSPITHYAAAAALEAVAGLRAKQNGSPCRLGVVVCLQSGCVQYTYRFFQETLEDPATASPLVFPETVFAAPASHVATLLENTPLVYTLMGDPANFLQGVALGAHWLADNRVEASLVIGAEEINWLRADALWHLEHAAIISGGAGAVCLSLDPAKSLGVELSAITDAHTCTLRQNRTQAARAMRDQLGATSPAELLCDGLGDSPRADAPELAAWRSWTGPRLSPKRILGEGLMAAAAWQCVAACDAVAGGRFTVANVSLVGCNQQAIGARFVRPLSTPPSADGAMTPLSGAGPSQPAASE
jgi:hypothetical protein